MKVLVIGDVVGRPGRDMVQIHTKELHRRHCTDLVVANIENGTGVG
ncbi:MAG: YmdB family metallophosphoesterase [Acidobacteriia bacterium]|nr:YmdB family metallophosphoesterase [Terriglobia bacterium]